jgi:Spy/CpxP family protein refolding chaperone
LQIKNSFLTFAIALVVGLALGFGGATLCYRYGWLPVSGERPFQRMARVLDLTPSQVEQIRAVMHQTRARIATARDAFEQQKRAIFVDAYLHIRAVLTPSQRKIFDARFVPPSIRAQARAEQRGAPTPSPTDH